MTGIPKSSVEANSSVSLVSEKQHQKQSAPTEISEPMFHERPIPLQTLQHWSLPVSQPGVSWPILFSCHTLQWRIPGDPLPAWLDKELWMKALHARCSFDSQQLQSCTMQKQPREQTLWEKNQMTLCKTSYIWPLTYKPDPVPLLWHITGCSHQHSFALNFLPMQEQQAQRQKHWNNMKRKDRSVLSLDLFHHRKVKWKLNLTKVKLLSRRLLTLNLFLGQGIRLQEPGTEQQVWDLRNAREPPS